MDNSRWKIALQYTIGILVLALCTAAALYLPGWYADRQDEELMGKVSLSNRETVDLINIASLEIEETLKTLQSIEYYYFEEVSYFRIDITEEELLDKCGELVQDWCEAGLLPDSYALLARDWERYLLDGYITTLVGIGYDYNGTDRFVCSCAILRFVSPDHEDGLTVVMDIEKQIIYYASASGHDAVIAMCRELGYDSAEELVRSAEAGEEPKTDRTNPAAFDFASVCGAEQATVRKEENSLELTAGLTYESFEGSAFRKVILNDWGYGMAVMFGTDRWGEFMVDLADTYGFLEYPSTTQELFEQYASAVEEETQAAAEAELTDP